ncbi:3-oxo-tetronate kinase [Paracoccus alkanivorans]|uniref:3-oxo-tetronate kinase n=1 Tax=Paracoccus alkanivorans TaxID=2116655 RepID=A0A3M0M5C4_9RHOB|nr:3-oxo-tetronate kinase [Paracoccus alkanivorans]RMC32443.1 four-carbon acid sugar kinase family protein [Paracoccus alkanivorans]
MILGCIADDFTGATDLAALLVRAGVPVSLRIGLPSEPASPGPPEAVEVIALKIRAIEPGRAVTQALAALDWLLAAGARHIYWKYCSTFDSTMRGNIGPVAQALMDRLGTERTVYVPSFPENGRRVFMGNLFVGDQPLAESPMKDHPLNPMRDSDLTRVLAPQLGDDAGKVGLLDWPTIRQGQAAVAGAIASGAPHLVCDALDDSDLEALAQAAHALPLLTGGSAFARHLPDAWRAAELLASTEGDEVLPTMPKGPAVVLAGSCSAMTRKQVAHFAAMAPTLRLDPQRLAEGDDGGMQDWIIECLDTGQDCMLQATAGPDEVAAAQSALGVEKAGAVVEEALARAARIARSHGAARLVVAGGETSGAITSALGITALRIGAEIAPGVPWCRGEDDHGSLALALKSGNFGEEDFFTRALEQTS